VKRVLVLGGYGGFGGRIAQRLAAEGWEVLVAGRDLQRAEHFCAGRPNLLPFCLDRDADLAAQLARHKPFAVVDAAGPFQSAPYQVPRACMAAGCHYLDIADARDFVTGIGVLDAEARAAGIAIVSGASSVPALSGAVVSSLAEGMTRIRSVEIAISASSKATAGPSLTKAIVSYLGRPIRIWRGQRWTVRHGWQEMRRESFCVAGEESLDGRLVGLADVPDLKLLPGRLKGNPAVTFRAGAELALQNRALSAASGLVRTGWIKRPEALIPAVLWVQRLMARLGTARSGMIVRMFGMAGGRRVERRWTLIANHGTGPEIPALAVPMLLRRILEGTPGPGARDAGTLLELEDFEPAFAAMSIRHETVEAELSPPLYARVLGSRFDELPASVRAMHDVLRDHGASGRAGVRRGHHPLARMLAAAMGFPAEGEHDLHVAFAEHDGIENGPGLFLKDRSKARFRNAPGLSTSASVQCGSGSALQPTAPA
jgi:NAD(P)-dependent dehydrogenase (short-subunit alcohol dehydrogenase family)